MLFYDNAGISFFILPLVSRLYSVLALPAFFLGSHKVDLSEPTASLHQFTF
jgi:hypothetical protein